MRWMTLLDIFKTKKTGSQAIKKAPVKDMGKVIYVDFTAPRKGSKDAYVDEQVRKHI